MKHLFALLTILLFAIAALADSPVVPISDMGGDRTHLEGTNEDLRIDDTRGVYVDLDQDDELDDGEHRLSSNPIIDALDYSADATLTETELQAAIDAVEALKGGTGGGIIQLPCDSNIAIDDTITISNNGMTLRGCGRQQTQLKATFPTTPTEPLIFFDGAARGRIEDLTLFSDGVETHTGAMLLVADSSQFTARNIYITGTGVPPDSKSTNGFGIRCKDSLAMSVEDSYIVKWGTGIQLERDTVTGTGVTCNGFMLRNTYLQNGDENLVVDTAGATAGRTGCRALNIHGGVIEGAASKGIVHRAAEANADGCVLNLFGPHMESSTAGVEFEGVGGSLSSHGTRWTGASVVSHVIIGSGNLHPHLSNGDYWGVALDGADTGDDTDEIHHDGGGQFAVRNAIRNSQAYGEIGVESGSTGEVTFGNAIQAADCTAVPASGAYSIPYRGDICIEPDGDMFTCLPDATGTGGEYGTESDWCDGDGADSWVQLQPFDPELETIAALTETEKAVMFVVSGEWAADTTPAIDCTDCTNIPAASDLADIGNVTLSTPADGAVLCFTGSANASVDCTLGGDATATEDSGTLTITVTDIGSATGTDALAFIVDEDNTGGSEPADGAGFKLEGGTGDITVLYNATDNILEVAGAASGYDFDGPVSATSFTADPSATPSLTLVKDTADDDDAFKAVVSDCADVTSDSEDCTADIGVISDGDMLYMISLDTAAGGVTTLELGDASGANLVKISEAGRMSFAGAAAIAPPTGSAFPGSPSAGDIFIVDDDSTIGACDSGGGSATTMCWYNGATWEPIGDGGSGSYLPLSGGVLTGEVTVDNLGLEFTEGDDHSDCSAFSSTGGGIFYDDSEGKFKKCQEGSLTDLTVAGPEVRSMYWGAGAISADGTNCDDPAETTIASTGPKQYSINCPLTADGNLYGHTVLPDGFVGGASSDLVFELSAYIADDPGATEDLYAVIYAQCAGSGDAASGSWTNHDDIDVQFVSADAQWAIRQDEAAAFDPDGTCAAGDVLYWRLRVCQAASGDCGSASTFDTTNTYIVGMKMEFTTSVGD